MAKKLFLTHVEEVFARDVVILAEDQVAANDKAEELCNCSAINLEGKDFLDRKITVNGELSEDEAREYQVYGRKENKGNDEKITTMEAYLSLEGSLCKEKNMPVETKSAMIWGALSVMNNQGIIDWNKMRCLYGEFMSKEMKLR